MICVVAARPTITKATTSCAGFEHDLFDQLNLIQLLSYLRLRPPVADVSPSASFLSWHPDFHGLGELKAEQLPRCSRRGIP